MLPQNQPPSSAPMLRVLLAEDDPSCAVLAATVLQHFGCHVEVVYDGRSAVRAAQLQHFDAIFMDFHMPELSGLDATRAIRAFEAVGERPRVTIIALTARAMPGDRDECLAAGMDIVLTKPFLVADLRAVVEQLKPQFAQRSG